MAADLNVLPLTGIANAPLQKLLQDLRNMQVGRQGFRMSVFNVINVVEGVGGNVTQLATYLGVDAAQAQVLYDELSAFNAHIDNNGNITGLVDSWNKINRICGISV